MARTSTAPSDQHRKGADGLRHEHTQPAPTARARADRAPLRLRHRSLRCDATRSCRVVFGDSLVRVKSCPVPQLPRVTRPGKVPTVFDTSTRSPRRLRGHEQTARLYVCGITPYVATHLGHAATYVAFDLRYRIWRDAG